MFENRVLRRVFGPKRDEVTGEWRKLHNEELNYLYSLPNIVPQLLLSVNNINGLVIVLQELCGVCAVPTELTCLLNKANA